jgi:hypothetical protein
MGAMAPGELDSARLRRDLSLLLRRRLVLYAGIGAAGLTIVLSLVAAATPSAATAPPANAPSSSDSTAGQEPQQPADQQPSFVLPAQPPQSGFGGSSHAISGGS